jgi:diguanylate cyclase (GGDEF)-like protein
MTKILVIEDEVFLRENILDLLHLEGYEVISAENGLIGVKLAQEQLPDLILCDVAMPRLDGYGVLKLLRQQSTTAKIPLIFLTAKATKADIRLGMTLGADDYLTKPFTQCELIEAIKARLVKQAAIAESYAQALQDAIAQLDDHLNYDRVTQLPNRLMLQEQFRRIQFINESLEGYSDLSPQMTIPILVLKINRYDRIHEMLGESGIDQLMKVIAQRLLACVTSQDTIARLYEDQFVIVLATNQPQDLSLTYEAILNALTQVFSIQDQDLFLTVSLGIASYPKDGRELDDLVRKANIALQDAQTQGGSRYQVYTATHYRNTTESIALESQLWRALERNEFQVHYQPQVSLKTGKIEGAEALVRWQNPERGLISPLDFIPIAEETGLIHPIGEWVLHTACEQTQAWRMAGFSSLRIAVNLSVKQFNQPDLSECISRILDLTQLPYDCLELELTESALMRDTTLAIATLQTLKSMGIQIAIDDFGTGYASLSYLKQFPFDALKIDRCFIRNIDSDRHNATITSAVLQMAHGLNLHVIAEGVETELELKYLCQRHCNTMQGYLFSRPLAAIEFENLLLLNRQLSLPKRLA